MALKLTSVQTPKTLNFSDDDKRTLHEIGSLLTSEMNTHGVWTNECSSILKSNPKLLFLYDRFEYILGNAYGHHKCKIAVNPMMLICLHPDCLNLAAGPLVRIRHPFCLKNYLTHLERHHDRMGDAMKVRFGAVYKNLFLTSASLDEISISPHNLQTVTKGNQQTAKIMENYGIERELTVNYVCHWKDRLLEADIINCESLTFQEDEALVDCILNYPNPVKDWSLWNTIYLYGLKFLTSVSATGLNLYRGITYYPKLNDTTCTNVVEFASSINHPTASLTSYQRDLPNLDYSNEIFQGGEILYHIKCLQKSGDSLGLEYSSSNVVRYPITLGIDEQELNPGTFVRDGVLHGLDKKMNAEEIKEIGLNNLSHHIGEKNNFITGVREYRATDFRDLVCSNVLTEFVSHELTGEECIERLRRSVRYANSCHRCLLDRVECQYNRIDERCSNCVHQKVRCISLVVIHVLWDMGSGHKKADLGIYHLSEDSPVAEMFSSLRTTIGFGGLHLCKSFVCTSRNYVLSHKGEHFGVNILMELKQFCEILQGINNSVFIGRDKQSDLLNNTLVGERVQQSLKSKSKYLITRVPEKYLTYKENAKSQNRIIMPKAMCSNRNGDVFLLDAGASCIHVIDNSTVAKVYMVGSYNKPHLTPYESIFENSVDKMRLGSDLVDIQVDAGNDDVVILDASREEVIVMQGCVIAKTVLSRKFYILKADGVLSIMLNSDLYVLRKSDDDYFVQQIRFQLPKRSKSKKENISLDHSILGTTVLTVAADITSLFYVPYQNMIGCFDVNKSSYIMSLGSERVKSVIELNVTTDLKPFVSVDGKMLCWSANQLSLYQLSAPTTSVSVELLDDIQLDGHVQAFSIRGKVVSIAIAMNKSICTNQYSVMEWGSLGFSLSYCEAVSKLYDAISYVPPHGNRQQMTLDECIEEAEYCCALLQNMQQERENMFSARESFVGCDGIPWSKTITCLERTIQSWKVLRSRMEVLEPGSSRKIQPHSIANESYVEHSFGFTKKKGQGHNQSQEEYVQSKRTHMVDFQLRMCKLPFCQYTKTKLRDKGYQGLESRQVPMSLKEFQEIFHYSNYVRPEANVSDDDQQILKKAHLLSRYVPRQSSRNRWRAVSGQAPSMITDRSCGCLYENDLVFHHSLSGDLVKLVVKKKTLLTNKSNQVKVCAVGAKKDMDITVEKLVYHKQQILTVPSAFYDIVAGEVSFSDEFAPIFESMCEGIEGFSEFSEEDWSVLVNVNEENDERENINDNCVVEQNHQEEVKTSSENINDNGVVKRQARKNKVKMKGKRKRVQEKTSAKRVKSSENINPDSDNDDDGDDDVEDDDDDDDDDDAKAKAKLFANLEELSVEKRILLMWVKVIYSGEIYLGKILNMHENQCLVRCLDKPFGVNVGQFQDFKAEVTAVWYDTVYKTDVEPVMIQEQTHDGMTKRRGRFRYIYGKKF